MNAVANEFLSQCASKDGNGPACLVYLVNGIKLDGQIIEFDDEGVIMTTENRSNHQLVMRQAISTVKPKTKSQ